jgi:hypothetical protein
VSWTVAPSITFPCTHTLLVGIVLCDSTPFGSKAWIASLAALSMVDYIFLKWLHLILYIIFSMCLFDIVPMEGWGFCCFALKEGGACLQHLDW